MGVRLIVSYNKEIEAATQIRNFMYNNQEQTWKSPPPPLIRERGVVFQFLQYVTIVYKQWLLPTDTALYVY